MDPQKKQKVMMGVLVAAVLGAGTFYWVSGRSDASRSAETQTGPVVRRARKELATVDKGPTRRDASKRTAKSAAPRVTTRRVKKDSGTQKVTRKGRVRRDKRQKKKVELKPLG